MGHDIAKRSVVVTSKAAGVSSAIIAEMVGLSKRTVDRIYERALVKGFDASLRPWNISDAMLAEAPRSGRPKKQSPEMQDRVLTKVRLDRYGREKTCADIAGEISSEGTEISATTIWRILKKAGLRKTKPTRKPGLTKAMREARLAWCLEHRDWTLEDWKNVIWTDETSIILLYRRRGYRIWCSKDERFLRSCIRERWKGASEFMFWGSFSYDKKGSCYCWKPETAVEKREADTLIDTWNAKLEPVLRTDWELQSGIRRLGLRQLPRKKPK
ncbi:hypothetical protein N7453_003888 [Penicillium expansum]|nr:hypothetical protein N7453_003888 [Penicillium expansum]